MSSWRKIYYKIFDLVLHVWVKSRVIPADPTTELPLDDRQPLLYVLPYYSKTDLLTLRRQCAKLHLPDPLTPQEIDGQLLPRYVFIQAKGLAPTSQASEEQNSVKVFYHYLDLHRSNADLNVQLIPTAVMFGRAPNKEGTPELKMLNRRQKLWAIIWLGRDSFVRFSQPVSLRYIANEHGTDHSIAQKLAKIARTHFARLRLAAVGPALPSRQALFDKLLTSPTIQKAIEDEASSKKIPVSKAKQHAIELLAEIAANFSYETLRLSDRVIGWAWNRFYQGINVQNAETIRQLAQTGHGIVYVPCHRSHMDYLLLSYVLYHQGIVPPHIAAGINLNFWPIGGIFRRLGAFYIRRTFKGNKLYSTLFREYLGELFTRGYSVEYFVEGGRSRTGRLLEPKTGTLTMTLQAMLRDGSRSIAIVPVYIGYEHVMEVATYAKELRGGTKEKESLWQMVRGIIKLRNLGQSYVNFAEPILLNHYLNQHVADWREAIDPLEAQRPHWLTPTVNNIAKQIMVSINQAAAVNAVNLVASALLAARQRALTREQLKEQLDCYLALLKNVPYSQQMTLPNMTIEQLIEHAIVVGRFVVDQDNIGDIITLPAEQAILATYYRNNIQHLLVLPALIASILVHHQRISQPLLQQQILLLYPLLKAELFLHYQEQQLPSTIKQLCQELIRQKLIEEHDGELSISLSHTRTLQLLAALVRETLQRYTITLALLDAQPNISRAVLEKESRIAAQRLSILHGINAPEFFDKAVFSTLIETLRKEGYLDEQGNAINEKTKRLYKLLSDLLATEVRLTIEGVKHHELLPSAMP